MTSNIDYATPAATLLTNMIAFGQTYSPPLPAGTPADPCGLWFLRGQVLDYGRQLDAAFAQWGAFAAYFATREPIPYPHPLPDTRLLANGVAMLNFANSNFASWASWNAIAIAGNIPSGLYPVSPWIAP
jgi:hypothetical protein